MITLVEGSPTHVVGWLSGMQLAADQNTTIIDPQTQTLAPLEGVYQNGLLTLDNNDGFVVSIDNDDILVQTLRVGVRLDANASAVYTTSIHGTSICAQVPVYGVFLQQLGFCNPQTDVINMYGAANARRYNGGTIAAPTGVGTIAFTPASTSVTATLTGSSLVLANHTLTILLVDAVTAHPVSLQYAGYTSRTADAAGKVTSVAISFQRTMVPNSVRAYLMIDGYASAPQTLTIP
jgi:hypothetical protein